MSSTENASKRKTLLERLRASGQSEFRLVADFVEELVENDDMTYDLLESCMVEVMDAADAVRTRARALSGKFTPDTKVDLSEL